MAKQQQPQELKKKEVLIMTATGCYNLGDELILKAEVEFLLQHYINVNITVFTYDQASSLLPEGQVKYVSYFPNAFWRHPFKNLWYFFENIGLIRGADFLIIGGGGLLFDNEKGVSFSALLRQWKFRTKLARIFGTHVFYWSLGIEVKKVDNRRRLKKLFVRDDIITVRDERSMGLLESLEFECRLVPDSAFLLVPQMQNVKMPEKQRVGFALRGGFLTQAEEEAVPLIVAELEKRGYQVVFLTHSISKDSDRNDIDCIKRIMNGKEYAITTTLSETLEAYKTMSFLVGMRYHAGIIAAAHAIPMILVPYGPKSNELIKQLEVPEHIESGFFTFEDFFQQWDSLVENAESRKIALKEKYDTIHNDLIKKLDDV